MEEYNIDDVSEKQIKFGVWYLGHIDKIKKVITIILIVFSAVTIGYGIFGFIYHYSVQSKLDQQLAQITATNIDFASFQARTKAENISFLEPEVIYSGNNSYDIFTKVVNPNERWLVKELTFQFVSGDYTSPTTTIYLLPQEERYLFDLAIQSPKRLSAVTINVMDIKWQRFKPAMEIPEVNFKTSKVDFFVSDNESRSWISFMVNNESINNFWEVTWQALLFSGRKVVGINQIRTEEFVSGQSREVIMSWFEKLPRVSTVEVYPVVDLLNPDITYNIPGKIDELY